jgi:short-subunit dehydrogenase
VPYVNGGSYCISKYGELGLSRVLREELKPHGVKVTAVMPGATYTDSWNGSSIEESRIMKPADVAEAIWNVVNMPGNAVVEELITCETKKRHQPLFLFGINLLQRITE